MERRFSRIIVSNEVDKDIIESLREEGSTYDQDYDTSGAAEHAIDMGVE